MQSNFNKFLKLLLVNKRNILRKGHYTTTLYVSLTQQGFQKNPVQDLSQQPIQAFVPGTCIFVKNLEVKGERWKNPDYAAFYTVAFNTFISVC